jgi:hypothetical protein
MTKNLLSNWHTMRWIQLIFGLYFIIETISTKEYFTGFLGGFLLFQAITNTGCCGAAGCAVQPEEKKENKIHDVDYTIVKP